MFSIAGGILIAVFVLAYLRVFLALGILLVACLALGLAFYFFDLDGVIHVLSAILSTPWLWVLGGLAIWGHFSLKKDDRLTHNIHTRHALFYDLQQVYAQLTDGRIDFPSVPSKYLYFHRIKEISLGHFWLVFEEMQYTLSTKPSYRNIKV
ncbi:MAG: hypothetical protein KGL57_05080, partial [Burkholderiales bacterium]|nr:hypothetical protein [Burkholderiales bacterium]